MFILMLNFLAAWTISISGVTNFGRPRIFNQDTVAQLDILPQASMFTSLNFKLSILCLDPHTLYIYILYIYITPDAVKGLEEKIA